MIIKPTIGRIVWFWPYAENAPNESSQPHAAIVTYVWDDRIINLAVFTPNGEPYSQTSVQLLQEGDERPFNRFAEWMPYQVGQAKRHNV